MVKKIKRFPLPLEPFTRHQPFLDAPGTARGAVWHIIAQWWFSGCPVESVDTERARKVAGMPAHIWKIHEKRIMQLLAYLMGVLLKLYKIQEVKHIYKSDKAALMRAAYHARRRGLKKDAVLDDAGLTSVRVKNAQRERPHNGRTDPANWSRSVKTDRPATLLTDVATNPFKSENSGDEI